MRRLSIILPRRPLAGVIVAIAVAACAPRDDEAARTPLPTRQTTIDPVAKKLDSAAQDVERRRAEIDGAAK